MSNRKYKLENILPLLSPEHEQLVLELELFRARLKEAGADEHLAEVYDALLDRVYSIIEDHSVSHTDLTESISIINRDDDGDALLPGDWDNGRPKWAASPDDDDEYCDPWLDPYCVEALRSAQKETQS